MKKLFLISIIILCSINLKAQEVTVGGSTVMCGSSTTSQVPAKYDDGSWTGGKSSSWSVMLYRKDDLNNLNGNLTQLGFYTDCYYSSKTYTFSNQRIYIKETTQGVITNSNIPDLTTFTKVYDGDITWKRGRSLTESKNIITLTTPFNYSGTKNLLVYFENESGKGAGWSGIPFLWDFQGEDLVAHTSYKLSDKSSSKGFIDKIRPVTYFKFSSASTPPEITMEANKSICSGNSFSFTGVSVTPSSPSVTLVWTTSGTGNFDNNTIKNPKYTPSNSDTGNITLKLTATNTDGSDSKNFTLTIKPLPNASIKKN